MRLLNDNKFIVNDVDDDDIVVDVNAIILLYKIYTKYINEIIKRKRRSYDIYNNFEFML